MLLDDETEKLKRELLDFLIKPHTIDEIAYLFLMENLPDRHDLVDTLWKLKCEGKVEWFDNVLAVTPQVTFKEILAKIEERDRGKVQHA